MNRSFEEVVDDIKGSLGSDHIFIVPFEESESGLCAEFMNSDEVRNTKQKADFIVDKQHEAEDLFLTYQFSTKASYVSDKTNYGNLFNYYHAGLLTKKEVFGLMLE